LLLIKVIIKNLECFNRVKAKTHTVVLLQKKWRKNEKVMFSSYVTLFDSVYFCNSNECCGRSIQCGLVRELPYSKEFAVSNV